MSEMIMPGDAEKDSQRQDEEFEAFYKPPSFAQSFIQSFAASGETSASVRSLQDIEKQVMKFSSPEAVPYVVNNIKIADEKLDDYNTTIHNLPFFSKIGAYSGKIAAFALDPLNAALMGVLGGFRSIVDPALEGALAEHSTLTRAAAKYAVTGIEGLGVVLPDSLTHYITSKTAYDDGFNSLSLMQEEAGGAILGMAGHFFGDLAGKVAKPVFQWFKARRMKEAFEIAQAQMETGNNVDVEPIVKQAFNEAKLDPENLSKMDIYVSKLRLEKELEKTETAVKDKIGEANEVYKTKPEEELTPFEISYRKTMAARKLPDDLTDFEKERLPQLEETDAIKRFDDMSKDRLAFLDDENLNEVEAQQRFSKSLEGRPIEEAHQELDDLFKKRDDLRQEIGLRNLALEVSDLPLSFTSEEELMGKYQKNLSAENQNLFDMNDDSWGKELEELKAKPETEIPEYIKEHVDNMEKLPKDEELLENAETRINREPHVKNLMQRLAQCLRG